MGGVGGPSFCGGRKSGLTVPHESADSTSTVYMRDNDKKRWTLPKILTTGGGSTLFLAAVFGWIYEAPGVPLSVFLANLFVLAAYVGTRP